MVSVTVKCTNQGILRRKFLVIFDSCLYRSDQYSLRDKKRNLEKSLLLLTGLPHVRKWSGKKKMIQGQEKNKRVLFLSPGKFGDILKKS